MVNIIQTNRKLGLPQLSCCLIFLSGVPCISQNTPKGSAQHIYSHTFNVVPATGRETAKGQFTIYGTVLDEYTQPVPSVEISNKRSSNDPDTYVVTYTDFDGNFSIGAVLGDTITFKLSGMISQEIVIKNHDKLNIKLKEPIVYEVWQPPLMHLPKKEEINVAPLKAATIAGKKRTFFGRIFHSVGNIFRKKDN